MYVIYPQFLLYMAAITKTTYGKAKFPDFIEAEDLGIRLRDQVLELDLKKRKKNG